LREMSEALEALTTDTALVLVLEDLHWSDHSTLDLLGMLARREETARLLVLGSYRPVDVIVTGHPLQSLLQELRVRRQCDDIALPFLDEPDTAAYLAQRFGAQTSSSDLAPARHRPPSPAPFTDGPTAIRSSWYVLPTSSSPSACSSKRRVAGP